MNEPMNGLLMYATTTSQPICHEVSTGIQTWLSVREDACCVNEIALCVGRQKEAYQRLVSGGVPLKPRSGYGIANTAYNKDLVADLVSCLALGLL